MALEQENPRAVERKQSQVKWVEGLLVSAQKRKWFGKITIDIKRGLIDLVKSEETLKPPEPEKNKF